MPHVVQFDAPRSVSTTVQGRSELGIDSFTLDFVYAGAVPGRRREDVSPVVAYRSGMRLLREAAGTDAYLVGCGAPVLPSVGLVDAMRLSLDTLHGERRGRLARSARPAVPRRSGLAAGPVLGQRPGRLVARPSYALHEPWAETVEAYGGLRSCSDRVDELDDWGLDTTRRVLSSAPTHGSFADELLEGSVR